MTIVILGKTFNHKILGLMCNKKFGLKTQVCVVNFKLCYIFLKIIQEAKVSFKWFFISNKICEMMHKYEYDTNLKNQIIIEFVMK